MENSSPVYRDESKHSVTLQIILQVTEAPDVSVQLE